MLPFSGYICITSRSLSVAVKEEKEAEWCNGGTKAFSSILSSLTSPAEGTRQLAAQEAATNDSDGLDVSGDFIQ